MKKFIIFIVALFIATPLWAANTTTVGSSLTTLEITGLDADWVWTTDMADAHTKVKNARIHSIKFYPSAASDRMIIRDGGVDAATFFDSGIVSGTTDARIEYYPDNPRVNLVIDISDCTLDAAANAKVVIRVIPDK